MKFLKTHYGRAIEVIPSDTANIPNPAGLGITGVASGKDTDRLKDGSATFTTNLLGGIVVNTTDGTIANIIGLVDSITLALDADIFPVGTESYAIYNSDNNQGCSLYIPAQTPEKLTVLMTGGDVVTFTNCGNSNSSTILPISVLRVFNEGTNLTDIIALW